MIKNNKLKIALITAMPFLGIATVISCNSTNSNQNYKYYVLGDYENLKVSQLIYLTYNQENFDTAIEPQNMIFQVDGIILTWEQFNAFIADNLAMQKQAKILNQPFDDTFKKVRVLGRSTIIFSELEEVEIEFVNKLNNSVKPKIKIG
ncbi:hypothetical protein ACW95P_04240 [Candidatus Mycoplasma pogonae]